MAVSKTHDQRNIQLLINYDDWLHNPKSDLKKLSMSNVKDSASDDDIVAVAKAVVTLIGPKDEAFLEGVKDIQYYVIRI